MLDDATREWPERAVASILCGGRKTFPQILVQDEDVHLKVGETTIRYGYFVERTFWRENPVPRATLIHAGAFPREGPVEKITELHGRGAEPQYDLVIEFNGDGSIRYLSDKRTAQELD